METLPLTPYSKNEEYDEEHQLLDQVLSELSIKKIKDPLNSSLSTDETQCTLQTKPLLSKNQIKRMKQKRKKKIKPENSENPTNDQSNISLNDEKDKKNEKLSFEKNLIIPNDIDSHIKWCVDQLELGLNNVGLSNEQRKESLKVIKQLQNPQKSIAAKRHLMAVVFGDYRKLMTIYYKENRHLLDLKTNID